MIPEDRQVLEWAALHLVDAKTTDAMPLDGYYLSQVWDVLQRAAAEGMPAVDAPITTDSIRLLATLAADVLARERAAQDYLEPEEWPPDEPALRWLSLADVDYRRGCVMSRRPQREDRRMAREFLPPLQIDGGAGGWEAEDQAGMVRLSATDPWRADDAPVIFDAELPDLLDWLARRDRLITPAKEPAEPSEPADDQDIEDVLRTLVLRDVERLALRPGDVLVVHFERLLPEDVSERLRSDLEERLGTKVLFMGPGTSLSVIGPEDA